MLTAFPLQKCLPDRGSMLRYICFACLVLIMLSFSYHFRTKLFFRGRGVEMAASLPLPQTSC
jgi:hypothetical protein